MCTVRSLTSSLCRKRLGWSLGAMLQSGSKGVDLRGHLLTVLSNELSAMLLGTSWSAICWIVCRHGHGWGCASSRRAVALGILMLDKIGLLLELDMLQCRVVIGRREVTVDEEVPQVFYNSWRGTLKHARYIYIYIPDTLKHATTNDNSLTAPKLLEEKRCIGTKKFTSDHHVVNSNRNNDTDLGCGTVEYPQKWQSCSPFSGFLLAERTGHRTEAPNSPKTRMINGVLLLVFPCPNA